MLTITHSSCPTARLFALKSLFSKKSIKKHILITDSDSDIVLLQSFAKVLFNAPVLDVASLGDFWLINEAKEGIFCIRSSLLETQGSIEYLKKHSMFEVFRGMKITIEDVINLLISFGYHHATHLGELGTYRREGSIISITDSIYGNTIHIEWFDTEIDSIIEINHHNTTRIFKESIIIQNNSTQDSPITRDTNVLNQDLLKIISNHQLNEITLIGCDFLGYIDTLREHASIHFTEFHRDNSDSIGVDLISMNHIDEFLGFIREYQDTKKIQIYTKFTKTISEFIEFHQLGNIEIIENQKNGLQSCKFGASGVFPELENYTIIADDIIGSIFVRKRSKKSIAKHLDLLLSLKRGDLVVHREHGIGIFDQVIRKNTGSIEREYLELHYAEGDKLFVPITELYRVSKYLGKQDIELTKLSGKEWEKTMEKTNEEIEAIAQDILETNARRSIAKGRSFAKFRDKEIEFQNAFSYEYTLDQKNAIDEIFGDMESEAAMDRLISGDVGFGKTEIAMNAIYKAVLGGTQVAVISPLLVLADEHYETFVERLGAFGVRIGIMTRMNSQKEIQDTLLELQNGNIDVIVGTHRLLSDDVKFRKLGLLVIDEEHKFGVSHKEKIKKIRAGVDILALSATPIPRSLNLALSGLKKISVIGTPPKKKKPIETIITRWNESTIFHAIENEIKRGGQVIILHNRIRGMESLAKEIETIIHSDKMGGKQSPKVVITHGQMDGEEIENRIHSFKKHEFDILLSTTIIENGVNFLSANTIIIIDPEEFGLASLHQLRGRVGRKDIDAFCYLIYRKPELAKEEKERLITIANNTHLGAGFEIAMRDMEIRGAGDVLGIKQSGKSKDVGLTLYFRLLEERIEELKNERKRRSLTKIELDISYIIPDEFFLSESDKLNFFREIENIETIEDLEILEEEIMQNAKIDHQDSGFLHLFILMRARIIFSEFNIEKISKVGINYVFDMQSSSSVDDTKRFLERFDRENRMILLSTKKIRVETNHWKNSIDFLKNII